MACELSLVGLSETDNSEIISTIPSTSDLEEEGSEIVAMPKSESSDVLNSPSPAVAEATESISTEITPASTFHQKLPDIKIKSIERTLIPLVQQVSLFILNLNFINLYRQSNPYIFIS